MAQEGQCGSIVDGRQIRPLLLGQTTGEVQGLFGPILRADGRRGCPAVQSEYGENGVDGDNEVFEVETCAPDAQRIFGEAQLRRETEKNNRV